MKSNNRTGRRWIGIDGGGTKTSCVIGDEQGYILSHVIGSSSNIQTIPHQTVFNTITKLIEQVLEDSGSTFQQIESINLCLAGADRERDKRIVKSLFEHTIYEEKINITSDAQAALTSGTWGESGLLLIVGTGSIVYGFSNESGQSIRVGGWGYLLGDEGSGFFIGQRALKAVFESYDNRGPKTALTTLILNHFQLQHVPELIMLYSNENIVATIASLSKYVVDVAKIGDVVAVEILEDAISELVRMVEIASKEPFINKDHLLVLHGGLFSDFYFKDLFMKKLKLVIGDIKIVQSEIPAVVGAYLLAIKEAGRVIDEEMKRNVKLSWNKVNQQ